MPCEWPCRQTAALLLTSVKKHEIINLRIESHLDISGHYNTVLSAIIYPWLVIGLSPHCPQVEWCHWGEIEPFSATLAQDGLMECDQPKKIRWNAPPWLGHREDRQWAIPLSYHDWQYSIGPLICRRYTTKLFCPHLYMWSCFTLMSLVTFVLLMVNKACELIR